MLEKEQLLRTTHFLKHFLYDRQVLITNCEVYEYQKHNEQVC
jgi:hypothetical protein